MTIHRKILKVPTAGNRQVGNLRPIIADSLPQGINYAVLEYTDADTQCVVEVWSSDHEKLDADKRKDKSHLEKLKADFMLEELPTHPKSPKILAAISTTEEIENLDEEKKKATIKGKAYNFLRKQKFLDTVGREQEELVLDEG